MITTLIGGPKDGEVQATDLRDLRVIRPTGHYTDKKVSCRMDLRSLAFRNMSHKWKVLERKRPMFRIVQFYDTEEHVYRHEAHWFTVGSRRLSGEPEEPRPIRVHFHVWDGMDRDAANAKIKHHMDKAMRAYTERIRSHA